jgi:hypothetical protein
MTAIRQSPCERHAKASFEFKHLILKEKIIQILHLDWSPAWRNCLPAADFAGSFTLR